MSRLSKIIKQAVAVGNYTTIDDIAKNYPEGVIVNGIVKKAAKNNPNAYAFTFIDTKGISTNSGENDSDNMPFFFAESGDLKRIVEDILTAYNNDITAINNDFQLEPIILKVYKIVTSNGRMYVKADLIENTNSEN